MIDIIFNLQLIDLMIQYQNPIFNSYVLLLIYSLLSLSCLSDLSCFRNCRSFSPFLRKVIFLFCSSLVLRFQHFGSNAGCARLILSNLMMQSLSIFYSISYLSQEIASFSLCFLFLLAIIYRPIAANHHDWIGSHPIIILNCKMMLFWIFFTHVKNFFFELQAFLQIRLQYSCIFSSTCHFRLFHEQSR